MKEKIVVEVCCGSYYDAKEAILGGAKRIELNSGLWMGGLTPTTATMKMIRKEFPQLKVIAMVRPRGGGFCYKKEDVAVMMQEAGELLDAGADGIAFGFLKEDKSINTEDTKNMVKLIKSYKKEAVFHRAFDCLEDWKMGIEVLIENNVDRVLTSGLAKTAWEGKEIIRELHYQWGNQIEILAGGGISADNLRKLLEETKVKQIHSSCKSWCIDPTTMGREVSYAYAPGEKEMMYDVVEQRLVRKLVQQVIN